MMSTSGSSASAAAPIQLPAHVAGVNTVDPFSMPDDGSTLATPITLSDSSDEDNGSATISKVINNEIVSFYLLIFRWMYDDHYSGRLSYF